MPRLLRPAAAALLTCALLASCTGTHAVDDGTGGPQLHNLPQADAGKLLSISDRVPAPVLRGETLDGKQLDVAALRGKVVVVNFWASWCSPCRAESPYLIKVAADTASLGVTFVGVDIKDDLGPARRFVDVHHVPYPSLYDQPGVSLTRLRKLVPQSPPSTMLIDKSGRIAALFVGGVTDTELASPVRALASEQA